MKISESLEIYCQLNGAKVSICFIACIISTCVWSQKKDSITSLNEVSVASKTYEKLQEIGKNITLLTSQDLANLQGKSLENILNAQLGIQINGSFTTLSNPKTFNIRGGKNKNVVILLNDVPLKEVTGNDYNSFDMRNLIVDNIESIEILNGASSVLYGSNASASVINIKTKKDINDPFIINVLTSVGSFDTHKQGINISGKLKNFSYNVSGNNLKSNGMSAAKDINNSNLFDKDGVEKQNLTSQLEYEINKTKLGIDLGYNHLLYHYDVGAFTDGNYKGKNTTKYIGLNFNQKHKFGKLVVHSRISNSENTFMSLKNNTYKNDAIYKGKNIFLEAFNSYKINNNIDVIVGLQYENQKLNYNGNIYLPPIYNPNFQEIINNDSTKLRFFDTYIQTKAKFSIFNIAVGARLNTHNKYKSQFTYNINPYILLPIYKNTLKLGFSYSTAYNSPTLYQLYGDAQFVLGNSNLVPEDSKSHEIDLAYFTKKNNLKFLLSLFYRDENDIFQYITDSDKDKGTYINVNKSNAKGLEFGIQYSPIHSITLSSNFSYLERDTELAMFRIPQQKWNNSINFNLFKGNSITFSHQFTGSKFDSYYDSKLFSQKPVVNNSFHLFNVFTQQKINKYITIFGSIQNIFNASYVDIIGYNERPRVYEVGIKLNL